MTVLRILQYPDPRLQRKGALVTNIDARIQQIVADMFETHYAAENCAALAATQLDMVNPPHITVIDFSSEKDQPLCLINAKILSRDGQTDEEEGCMSVRGIYDKVKRAEKITVSAMDEQGQQKKFSADGFMAKCIQHELDHLEGKIFLDRLSRLKRQRVDKKLRG